MALFILIVEDQPRLAVAMAAILRAEGFSVSACPSTGCALAAIKADPGLPQGPVRAAILDVNVEDGPVYAAADELAARGIPYGFCTSMEAGDLPERHRGAPYLAKPFDLEGLVGLAHTLEARGVGRQLQ